MTEYSKFNIVYHLQRWMDSVPGQTFLNYAYSWGASVVILGTLFKLTHLPGANIMLFLGMGTEVVVFFLSAFDRPFDKTQEGKELPTHITEEYMETGQVVYNKVEAVAPEKPTSRPTVIAATSTPSSAPEVLQPTSDTIEVVQRQQQITPEMEQATSNYVAELNRLTEMLAKVSEQSQRLTTDSEEMENLNRTLTGICKIYEMQLKGASRQIGTIDQINEQSTKMAQQIEQLNRIYTRMIEAMTVNMRATTQGQPVDTL